MSVSCRRTRKLEIPQGSRGLRSLPRNSAYCQTASAYGPLPADPNRLLNLPAGFRYVAISRTGEMMDDGFSVPGAHGAIGAPPAPMAEPSSSEITNEPSGTALRRPPPKLPVQPRL